MVRWEYVRLHRHGRCRLGKCGSQRSTLEKISTFFLWMAHRGSSFPRTITSLPISLCKRLFQPTSITMFCFVCTRTLAARLPLLDSLTIFSKQHGCSAVAHTREVRPVQSLCKHHWRDLEEDTEVEEKGRTDPGNGPSRSPQIHSSRLEKAVRTYLNSNPSVSAMGDPEKMADEVTWRALLDDDDYI